MRTPLMLALILIGVGCQGISPFCNQPERERPKLPVAQAPGCEGLASKAVLPPAAPSASRGTAQPVLKAATRKEAAGEVTTAARKEATGEVTTAARKEAAGEVTTAARKEAAGEVTAAAQPVPRVAALTRTSVTHGTGEVTPAALTVAAATAPAPPGMVPSRVQTTTTYKHYCKLDLDYLHVRLAFPHLRIFTGPDTVVTQTEFVPVPPTPPERPEYVLPPLSQ